VAKSPQSPPSLGGAEVNEQSVAFGLTHSELLSKSSSQSSHHMATSRQRFTALVSSLAEISKQRPLPAGKLDEIIGEGWQGNATCNHQQAIEPMKYEEQA